MIANHIIFPLNKRMQFIVKLLLFVFFLFQITLTAYTQTIFKTIPIANKKIRINKPISQARITDILEDERGFMWFATIDGLNRYDGYEIKIFRHVEGDSTSIASSQIVKLLEDIDGYIWIITAGGLDKFDPYLEVFTHFQFPASFSFRPSINDLAFDKHQNLWMGTTAGLFMIESGSAEIKHFPLDKAFFNIESLMVDLKNDLWIGSDNAIVKKYSIDKKMLSYYPISSDKNIISSIGKVSRIYQDVNGKIWFSIYYNTATILSSAIFYFDQKNNKIEDFKEFQQVLNDYHLDFRFRTSWEFASSGNILWGASTQASIVKFDLDNGEIVYYPEYEDLSWHKEIGKSKINIDKKGLIWVGTNGDGVFILPDESNNFNLVNIDMYHQITQKSIRCFCEDEDYYWFGGYYGIGKINKKSGAISNVNNGILAYSLINFPGDSESLLVGTEGGGFTKLNKVTEKEISLSNKFVKGKNNSTPWLWIFSMYTEGDSICWAGCLNGIIRWDLKKNTFETFDLLKDEGEFSGQILSIYRDFSGKLWACSDRKGLAYYSDSLNKFVLYVNQNTDKIGMNKLRVNSITQSDDSVYWLGTSSGLMRMKNDSIRIFTEKDKLINDFVYSAIPADDGLIWMSTNNGICSIDPSDFSVNNYSVNEGLQDKEFNTGAYFKAKDGQIFFGGINGFNHFYPKDIHENFTEIPIVLTGVKWKNEDIKLDKKMVQKGEIVIPAEIEYFSIEFAGLNYLNAETNSYKYTIDNGQKEWIDLGTKNEIGFHNLGPGVYLLKILAANNQGKWTPKPLSITIYVEAHFWETIYFKLGLLILLFAAGYFSIMGRFKMIRKQKKQVEKLIEQRTHELHLSNENLIKANQTKDQFFSIISHDLKNPIFASLSITHELKNNYQDYSAQEREMFVSILDSSMTNLSNLLEKLLTWSRVQQQKMIAKPEHFSLYEIIRESKNFLSTNLQEKNLEFQCKVDEDTQVFADRNMLSTIIRNILSNAIKFTSNGGKIDISAKISSHQVIIEISDTGIGMSAKTLENLFIPGKTMSSPGTNQESGTGMGLLLIHDFVRLNNGKIWVVSQERKGSTFFVSLPHKSF